MSKNRWIAIAKKENKWLIIISKFLTKACKQLKLDAQVNENYPNILKKACIYLISEKNQEDYWIINYLLKQVRLKAILIFKALFSNCIAIFAFDNSLNRILFKIGHNWPKVRFINKFFEDPTIKKNFYITLLWFFSF